MIRWPDCQTNACTPDAHTPPTQAVWRVHWPGQEINACDRCTAQARAVAEVMGFKLALSAVEPLPDEERLFLGLSEQ